MALDNVVPIDAEAARMLEERRHRFRRFVALLSCVWLGLLLPVVFLTPLPPIAPFIVLAALVILAEHRFVLFGDETSMSASIVVIVGSVFVFADTAPLAGPMLVASLAGLYLPHIRHRRFSLIAANTASFGIAAFLAATFISPGLLGNGHGAVAGVTAAYVAVLVYWCSNSVLTGAASAVRNNLSVDASIQSQVTSEWPVILLAGCAALLAQASVDPRDLPTLATLAVPLVAFEIGARRTRTSRRCCLSGWHLGCPAAIAAAFASMIDGVGAFALLSIGAFLSIAIAQAEGWRTHVTVASIVLGSLATCFVLGTQVPFALTIILGALLTSASMTLLQFRLESRGMRTRIDLPTSIGVAFPSRREVVLVLALSGAALAVAQVTAHPSLLAGMLVVLIPPLRRASTPQAGELPSPAVNDH